MADFHENHKNHKNHNIHCANFEKIRILSIIFRELPGVGIDAQAELKGAMGSYSELIKAKKFLRVILAVLMQNATK